MIIKQYELKKIEKKKYNIYLFYGKNNGFKDDVISDFFLKNFDGKIIRYDEKEFINNFDVIATEILTKSLFESKKILIISRVSDKISKYIEEINNSEINDISIILKSEILEKRSKLRSLFERNSKLITVPFYEESSSELTQLVINFLRDNKIKLSRESVNLLVNRSSGDRENIKIELEKILNYSFSNKNIDFEVVSKLSNLAENFGISELADSFLEKNLKNVVKILNENNFSQDDCILITRTVLNKSKRLLNIIERFQKNNNLEEVISNTKPSIFWKDKEIVKKQVNNWKLIDLKNKIYQINEIESLIKNNSQNSLNILFNFMLNY